MGFLASLSGIRTKLTSEPVNQKSRYRSVQVHANSADCCEAARAIEGKRFLSTEVPRLPLEDCDADDCRCTYELFDDRRTDFRQASNDVFGSPVRSGETSKQ